MQTDIERMLAAGRLDSVETILNGSEQTPPPRFEPARLDGCPPLPEPGIYFGMSDEEYHSLPALSNSGIKKLAASPMIFWAATPWLSEAKRKQQEEAEEKAHHIFGKAYHCRLLEGASVFAMRYAVELDPTDYPDCLESTAQIKAAISQHMRPQPVKPCSAKKDELQIQLYALRHKVGQDTSDVAAMKVDELKAAIRLFEEDMPVVPVRQVPDQMPDGSDFMRDAVKADWIEQLLELDPDAKVFAKVQARHRAEHDGKTFLYPDQMAELEIAAAMIERDPELKNAFRNGYPEVVLIWYCATTGVPMKAKVDFMKIKYMIDLKSISNQRERSIENAIRFEIAAYHYNIQPRVYFEGAQAVRELVRKHGVSRIFVNTEVFSEAEHRDVEAWALKWASHRGEDDWLWVFQQKGAAPISRGVWYPRAGTTNMVTGDIVSIAKKRFRTFSETFGTDPWIDAKPIYTIADEDIPQSATEI